MGELGPGSTRADDAGTGPAKVGSEGEAAPEQQEGDNAVTATQAGVGPDKAKILTDLAQATTKDGKVKLAASIPANIRAIDFLPIFLDAVMFQAAATEKSYSMVVDLNGEISRKLANAPVPVQEFYREMRQAQLDHKPVGLKAMEGMDAAAAQAYRDSWAEMNGWLAFPENDAECQEGRDLVQKYLKRKFDRKGVEPPPGPEKEKDYDQLADIYSLSLNDHDYLHNDEEITIRGGTDHLPEKFAGIGADGQPKEFNLRALAKKHMFYKDPKTGQMTGILLGTAENQPTPAYKSPLASDERANLDFYCQVLRQVFPGLVLANESANPRAEILKDYVDKYKARDANLAAVGTAVWQTARDLAKTQFPEMSQISQGLKLTDAEEIYQLLNLANVRQLAIEAEEMRKLFPNVAKGTELAYPDQGLMYAWNRVSAAMREYREGQVLNERQYLRGVFQASVAPYLQFLAHERPRLKNWPSMPAQIIEDKNLGRTVVIPRGVYQDWQSVYWNDNPNELESRIQRKLVEYAPRSLQCSYSNELADLIRRHMGPDGLFGNQATRLAELLNTLGPDKDHPCEHNSEPRNRRKL